MILIPNRRARWNFPKFQCTEMQWWLLAIWLLLLSGYLWRRYVLLECDDAPDIFHRIGGPQHSGTVAYLLYPSLAVACYMILWPINFFGGGMTICASILAMLSLGTFSRSCDDVMWVRRCAALGAALSAAMAYELTRRAIPVLLTQNPLLLPLWTSAMSFAAGAYASDSSHGALELVRTVSSATKASTRVAQLAKDAVSFEVKGFGAGWSLSSSSIKEQFAMPRALFPHAGQTATEEAVMKKLIHSGAQVPKAVYCWHPDGTADLVPLHTHGDGNCLLHAASNSLWGIGDDLATAKLRGAVLATIRDPAVKEKLWPAFRRSRCEVMVGSDGPLHIEMDDEQLEAEWASLVSNASRFDHRSAEYLEDVHLLLLAQVLRRPILVYGEQMVDPHERDLWVENPLRGLYLPYLHEQCKCHWSPVVMLFYPSHFVSLVPLESFPETADPLLVPISENSSGNLLPVRLLPTNNADDSMTLVKKYMRVHPREEPVGILAEIQTTQRTEFYTNLISLYLGAHGITE